MSQNMYCATTHNVDWATFVDKIYPVGSIYMSVNNVSPQSFMGGTWVAWGAGRVPVSMGDNGQTNYTTVEETGGNEKHKHNLPIITDNEYNWTKFAWNTALRYGSDSCNAVNTNNINNTPTGGSFAGRLLKSDNGDTRQPYITCYMYKRTA